MTDELRFRKLIEDLTRINTEIKTLETKMTTSKNEIDKNAQIDHVLFQANEFYQMENNIKNLAQEIENRIIPNLRIEMSELAAE